MEHVFSTSLTSLKSVFEQLLFLDLILVLNLDSRENIHEFVTKENQQNFYLTVKDFSVSGEEFQLLENTEFGFLETHPKPSSDKLPEYYQSEDYISHTDAKRNLFEKAYHLVRSISLKNKLRLINAVSEGEKRLLDFGCGTGDFLQIAQKNSWQVTGIEPNQQARTIANKKTNNSVFDVDALSKLEKQHFDVITLWHVLEHLPNLEDDLSAFQNLLKPNGTLIVAVPNYQSYDAKHYKNFWAAFDVPRHLWHFDKNAMMKLMQRVSMKVKKVKPMWFDAFYVSLLSEKYKSGKMNPVSGISIGLLSNLKALLTKEASSLIYIVKNS